MSNKNKKTKDNNVIKEEVVETKFDIKNFTFIMKMSKYHQTSLNITFKNDGNKTIEEWKSLIKSKKLISEEYLK